MVALAAFALLQSAAPPSPPSLNYIWQEGINCGRVTVPEIDDWAQAERLLTIIFSESQECVSCSVWQGSQVVENGYLLEAE